MKIILAMCVLVLGLYGCAASPEQIASMSDRDVALEYGRRNLTSFTGKNFNKHAKAELERRGIFTPEQWQRIDALDVQIDDPEVLVLASWGEPMGRRVRNYGGTQFEWWNYSLDNRPGIPPLLLMKNGYVDGWGN